MLDHAAEFNNAPPKEPLIFLKPPSSLLAPDDPIVLLPEVQRIDFEGELAVIMSRKCHNLRDGEDFRPYIAGYTLPQRRQRARLPGPRQTMDARQGL